MVNDIFMRYMLVMVRCTLIIRFPARVVGMCQGNRISIIRSVSVAHYTSIMGYKIADDERMAYIRTKPLVYAIQSTYGKMPFSAKCSVEATFCIICHEY